MPNLNNHSFQTRLHMLRHQVVRDLAWCCFSQPVMSELPGTNATILPFQGKDLWPWLNAIDLRPEELRAHIAQVKSTRLGIYYETLWRFYFSQQPEWKLLQHNLQVQRNGVTLGAFDFLCRRGEEYWHVETAVKFYLCNTRHPPDARDWNQWIGPSNLDRLDLKLSHLREHQLPLHETVEAKTHLQLLYPEIKNWKTGLCLQGYLFSPATLDFSPAFSSKDHGKGYWWYLRDFIGYQQEHADIQWIILERQRWLSPAHADDHRELTQGEKLRQYLQENIGKLKRPLLLAAMIKADSTDNYWQEEWRGFVVPDNWPENKFVN